jgi:DNA recombination protein RmuC
MPGSGEIADAIIKLQDGYVVAVDAKFPLSHFETYAKEKDDHVKTKLRTALMRDLKKHVTDIGNKYISPQDKTLDYAFMYIPVESIYYETMIHHDDSYNMWEFCLKQKVVPVSPNSFLAYLHTILVGLRGMKIQQQAREIMASISQFRVDFKKFNDDFSMVGKHINNAKNRYDHSVRRLDRFSNRLDQLEVDHATNDQLPPETN